jgi:hypothetical protein
MVTMYEDEILDGNEVWKRVQGSHYFAIDAYLKV